MLKKALKIRHRRRKPATTFGLALVLGLATLTGASARAEDSTPAATQAQARLEHDSAKLADVIFAATKLRDYAGTHGHATSDFCASYIPLYSGLGQIEGFNESVIEPSTRGLLAGDLRSLDDQLRSTKSFVCDTLYTRDSTTLAKSLELQGSISRLRDRAMSVQAALSAQAAVLRSVTDEGLRNSARAENKGIEDSLRIVKLVSGLQAAKGADGNAVPDAETPNQSPAN